MRGITYYFIHVCMLCGEISNAQRLFRFKIIYLPLSLGANASQTKTLSYTYRLENYYSSVRSSIKHVKYKTRTRPIGVV